MTLFDSLGFSWDRGSIPRQWPRASVERATFRFARMLPEYVWDAGVLEGNPFTFPEVVPGALQSVPPAVRDTEIPASRDRRSEPKVRLSAEELRQRAVQNWRKSYGPEAGIADRESEPNELGAPRRRRDADLDPSG